MPAVFVVIWSTGFIVAKFGLPYSSPLWFLNLRFVGVIGVLLIALPFVKVPWPTRRAARDIAIAGVLLQAGYLGGVWVSISEGMPAGLAALIVGLQPVITALAAPAIGERVSARQWTGFALGFVGVLLVVFDKIALVAMPVSSVALAVLALLSITIGTLYQKSRCPSFDLPCGDADPVHGVARADRAARADLRSLARPLHAAIRRCLGVGGVSDCRSAAWRCCSR